MALYTGNHDNVVADLLTPFEFEVNEQLRRKWIAGRLFGQCAVAAGHLSRSAPANLKGSNSAAAPSPKRH